MWFLNLWLYFVVVVFLTIQEAKGVVQLDDNCRGTDTGIVQNAIDEAISMAGHALMRQVGLRDGGLRPIDERVTLNTFNTYFGMLAAPNLLINNGRFIAPNAIVVGDALISKSLFNN